MLRWSLNLFRIRGIQLSVHAFFFLLLFLNGFYGWADGGWIGVAWNSAVLVAFFGCVILHELGHSFTAMRFGIGVQRILLLPIGGMAEFDSIPREPRRELLITIAGPAVNFAIAALLWGFVPASDEVSQYSIDGFIVQLFWANIFMGCFNFLPAFPMDGGRILRALLATRISYLRATFIAATVGKVLCVLAGLVALFGPELGIGIIEEPLPLVAALFAFIFVVGELEYRATRRREIDDAHQRAMLVRWYPIEPTVEEPPLLTR
jgi:Zn-dependent protease